MNLAVGTSPITVTFSASGDRAFIRTLISVVSYPYDITTGVINTTPLFTIPSANANTYYGVDQLAVSGDRIFVPSPGMVKVYDAVNGSFIGDVIDPAFVTPIGVAFAINTVTFTVTPVAEPGGSLTPNTPQSVQEGFITSFTVAPDDGYQIDAVSDCNGLLSGDIYTTGTITNDCTVTATFMRMFTVTPVVGPGGGVLTPDTPQLVPEGLTTSFTVKPDDGYQINAVSGCNGSLSDDSYTTGPITNDCTVTATFALPDTGLPFPLQHLINTSGIISAPDALSNPRNDNDGRYVVSWGASRTSGATYVLEEATNRSFTRNKRTVYSGKETSIRLKYRNTDTTYYYRVKAINSYGTESGWVVGTKGTAVSRSSSQVPLQSSAAVLPQAPALTVSLANQIVSLAWNAVSGAEGYRLYYAPYPYAGEHTIQSVEMGGKTEAQYTLPAGTAYYVAVKSYKGSEESSFSNIELTVE